jgi:hypothetical protein
VLEFAMYSLELKIKFKRKLEFISDLPTIFFFHNISGNAAFFKFGLIFMCLYAGEIIRALNDTPSVDKNKTGTIVFLENKNYKINGPARPIFYGDTG